MVSRTLATLLTLALARATPVIAQLVVPPAGTVVAAALRFDAKATAGDFAGTTSSATGAYSGGPVLERVTGYIETPVASLRTQNDGRDGHLREALASDSFPVIRFDVAAIRTGVSDGDTLAVVLVGSITAHGVTRSREVAATLMPAAGGVRLLGRIPMSFREFGIRKHLSKFLGIIKVSDEFMISVDVTFGAAPP